MKYLQKCIYPLIIILNIQISFSKKIYIEYNEEFDFITKDGKYYFPVSDSILNKKIKNLRVGTQIRKTEEAIKEEAEPPACVEEMVTGGTYWFFMFMVAVLTLFAGMMSGLTVGYLSVDQLTMELRENTGTPEEKKASEVILPVLSSRHWLLCTLLLMNSFAMEALPVFLDRVFSRFTAVVISVTLLLIFGEVIPQALCTGQRQVQIAAMAAPMTRFLMIISWPITYWLGKCLDIILGEQGKTRYQNQDLKCLVEMHTNEALRKIAEEEEKNPYIPKTDIPKPSENMGLGQLEANLMISALEIKEKKAVEIMINFNEIYSIKYEEPIDKKKVVEILDKGFSRIPVFRNDDKTDLIGLLRIKQLIKVDFNQRKSLKELGIRLKPPLVIPPNMTLINLLRQFRSGKSHMAFITEQVELLQAKFGLTRNNSVAINMLYNETFADTKNIKILGIVTLEDVIEQIFNLEIMDEEDYERSKRNKGNRMGSNLRSPSMLAFYSNPEVKGTFIKETTNEIKGIIKGLKNNVEMKEKIKKEIEINKDEKKESLLNEQ
jgi:CBS domain containing-hemolysin-like protein